MGGKIPLCTFKTKNNNLTNKLFKIVREHLYVYIKLLNLYFQNIVYMYQKQTTGHANLTNNSIHIIGRKTGQWHFFNSLHPENKPYRNMNLMDQF